MHRDIDEKSPARHLSNTKCEYGSGGYKFKFKDETTEYKSQSLLDYKQFVAKEYTWTPEISSKSAFLAQKRKLPGYRKLSSTIEQHAY